MTVIQAAVSRVHPDASNRPALATATSTGIPFAELLDGTSSPVTLGSGGLTLKREDVPNGPLGGDEPLTGKQTDNVFGFSELGVFGRRGLPDAANEEQMVAATPAQTGYSVPFVQMPAELDATQIRTSPEEFQNSVPVPMRLDDILGRTSPEENQGSVPEGEIGGVSLASPDLIVVSDEPRGSLDMPSQVIESFAQPSFGSDPEAVAPSKEPGFFPKSALPQGNKVSPVSLTVSGSDDALAIVARGAIENDTGLHQLLKDVAAEFGVDIASLSLNGSASQEMIPTSLGGKNGGGAR